MSERCEEYVLLGIHSTMVVIDWDFCYADWDAQRHVLFRIFQLDRTENEIPTLHYQQYSLITFLIMIKTKRIYDKPESDDGFRILVDIIWPRGLKKSEVKIDLWQKDVAPSSELRKWFNHDQRKWNEFIRSYYEELNDKQKIINPFL